jgi:muramoyltetrapeptide carboxypeptidase
VIAPSGAFDPAKLEAGMALARAAGADLHPLDGLLDPVRYLASADSHRLHQLTEALTSPGWDAVWVARGGFGLTRILSDVPWRRVRPKTVIGFSDATPLLEAMRRVTGAVGVHGPVIHSLPETDAFSRERTFDLIFRGIFPPLTGETWVHGEAEGPLVGGNLAMLAATCGTRWQVDAAGAILALEDVGEAPYRIDRMLTQLAEAGVLDAVAGVALGGFTACVPPAGAAWTLDDVLRERLATLGVPVVAHLPFGHQPANAALPIGARVRLADGALSLTPEDS